jgi:hypothetical protein
MIVLSSESVELKRERVQDYEWQVYGSIGRSSPPEVMDYVLLP